MTETIGGIALELFLDREKFDAQLETLAQTELPQLPIDFKFDLGTVKGSLRRSYRRALDLRDGLWNS